MTSTGSMCKCCYPAFAFLGRPRNVATGAVLCKQRTPLGRQRFVDGTQQGLRPGRRLESLQGFFDLV